jgi:DNA polymerase I
MPSDATVNSELEASLKGLKLTDVQSLDELWEFQRWLGERRNILGVDIETGGLSLKDRVRTVQFGDAKSGYCLAYEDWRGAIREALENYSGPVVGHNIKFDWGRLQHNGLTVPWAQTHDTMMMLNIVDSLGPKALKPAAGLHIGPTARAGQNSLKKHMNANHWTWDTIPVHDPLYTGYGILDTCITAILAEELWPKVQYAREAYDMEMACSRVLCDMELRGARIDTDYVQQARAELSDELEQLIDKLGGINPNSASEIIATLINQGAQLTKVTDKGQLSTDDDVMRELEEQGFEMAGLIRGSRANYKIIHSYFDNWLREEIDGFLHPSINQFTDRGRTGRMSVTNPALQTLHKSKKVRRAFIPREGNLLVFTDYSNEEVRLAGHVSGDEAIIRAFAEGRDLHTETAKRVFGTSDGCTHESKCKHRSVGKTGFLGKLYGSGVDTFAKTVGMSAADASVIHHKLDELYPGLARTMSKVTQVVQRRARELDSNNGYVVLPDNRKIMIPANAGYKGLNGLVQGTAAIVLKRAIIDLDLAGLGDFLIVAIHDELMFDAPKELVPEVVPQIERIMTREDFRVPLTVESDIVENWGVKYE